MDDKGQISAEMILLIGALLILVIIAGSFILDISQSVAGNVSLVVDQARDVTINKF
jgi:uncharacterized protein (UPF0333 family)